MGTKVVLDTTVIIKGFVKPRRRKKDEEWKRQVKLHLKAKRFLEDVEAGKYELHLPLAALIETACVVSRLTNDRKCVEDALTWLSKHSIVYPDLILFEEAVKIGIKTKGSGFDVLFIACSSISGGKLITDDKNQFENAKIYGIDTAFLRSENK